MRFKKSVYIVFALFLIIAGLFAWDYFNPESIARSSDGCFRFFGLKSRRHNCLDAMYNQGKEFTDFGSAYYILNDISDSDFESLKTDLVNQGGIETDSTIILSKRKGNIDGSFRLMKYPAFYQVQVSYEEVTD